MPGDALPPGPPPEWLPTPGGTRPGTAGGVLAGGPAARRGLAFRGQQHAAPVRGGRARRCGRNGPAPVAARLHVPGPVPLPPADPSTSTRSGRTADHDRTYRHVVVDEAQELWETDWRVLMRRCPSRSFTVVGDLTRAIGHAVPRIST